MKRKLLANDVVEIMQNCSGNALAGRNAITTFSSGNQSIIFSGRKLESSFKSDFAACDVFLEENGKKKVLYSVSSLKAAGLAFARDANGSIKAIKELAMQKEFLKD